MKIRFLLTSVLLFALMAFSTTADTALITDEDYFERLCEMQMDAVLANQALMDSFEFDGNTIVYPDDFGGDYIGDDFKLYVLLTEDADIARYESILDSFGDVVCYKTVSNSFNCLMDTAEGFATQIPKECFHKCGVDVKKNMAFVGVYSSYKDYVIEKFDLEYRSDADEYVYEDIVIVDVKCRSHSCESSYMAGTSISITSGGTLGGSGIYQTNITPHTALITAGHCATSVGDNAYISGTYVGSTSLVRYQNNGYGDYAIINAANGVQSDNRIIAGGGNIVYLSGYINNPPVGMYLGKFGKTSLYAYCQVTAVGIDTQDDTGTVTKGMTETIIISGDSSGGDSGGPYWSTTNYCGVHSGSAEDEDYNHFTYFTPNYYLRNNGFYVDCD